MNWENSDIARWRSLFGRLFDRHAAQMALLDLQGIILETNEAWKAFGRENGLVSSYNCVGQSYIQVCEAAVVSSRSGACEAYLGLLEVIHTHRPKFTMLYPCNSPGEKRSFRMWVEPQMPSAPVIIVAHYQLSTHPNMSATDSEQTGVSDEAEDFNLYFRTENAVYKTLRKTVN